jgi:Dolichyl-phosphate-mannose-protein mannosyltransferase
MIERGDYIVPHFNNQLRLDKPPLAYWAQVASYRIFGQDDFAARFPSAIAAALVALSILAWGKQIAGDRVGWWATIIFTLSLQTFVHAKAAVADMWLVLFVTLAHWAGYELLFQKRPTSNAERPTLNYRRGELSVGRWTLNVGRFLSSFRQVTAARWTNTRAFAGYRTPGFAIAKPPMPPTRRRTDETGSGSCPRTCRGSGSSGAGCTAADTAGIQPRGRHTPPRLLRP